MSESLILALSKMKINHRLEKNANAANWFYKMIQYTEYGNQFQRGQKCIVTDIVGDMPP